MTAAEAIAKLKEFDPDESITIIVGISEYDDFTIENDEGVPCFEVETGI